jgi:hypothetical protein
VQKPQCAGAMCCGAHRTCLHEHSQTANMNIMHVLPGASTPSSCCMAYNATCETPSPVQNPNRMNASHPRMAPNPNNLNRCLCSRVQVFLSDCFFHKLRCTCAHMLAKFWRRLLSLRLRNRVKCGFVCVCDPRVCPSVHGSANSL